MNSQKLENVLNLSFDATEEERQKSQALSVGFNQETKTWDVIVRSDGSLLSYENSDMQITELLGGYSIITASREQIDRLTQIPEISYIEMPKRLYFSIERGRSVSCINSIQTARSFNNNPLLGKGCLIGILDSGIDYTLKDFRNRDGSTRILKLWDQTAIQNGEYMPPSGYRIGVEYTKEQIDAALQQTEEEERKRLVPETDMSGHGTAVASIAAGSGSGQYRGIAPESSLIVVKLGTPRPDGFPRTTELMQALDYVVKEAVRLHMPLAVNVSIGNTYGSHDGTSLIETFFNTASDMGRCTICVGSGNEGTAAGHTSGNLKDPEKTSVEFAVAEYESKLNLQLWKYYVDQVEIQLISPSGEVVGPFQEVLGIQRFVLSHTEILLYYGKPAPYTKAQEIYFEFIPARTYSYLNAGIWTIRMIPRRIVEGEYHMWLPSSGSLNIGTRFQLPTPDTTLTIPSTAAKVITVGAYDPALLSFADFSGRGYTRVTNQVKPDLGAPGTGILAVVPGGRYTAHSGTSFATPFVTGSAALLMEYGIVRNQDPYLYGEKVKAYLIRGARHLSGFNQWPNPMLGVDGIIVSS